MGYYDRKLKAYIIDPTPPAWPAASATGNLLARIQDMQNKMGASYVPPTIATDSVLALGTQLAKWTFANAALAGGIAIYIPFILPASFSVKRIFWHNGTTTGHTVAVAVYSADANNLPSTRQATSGSQTASGASAIQSVNITTVVLSAGLYFFGWFSSNGGNGFGRWATNIVTAPRMLGCYEEAGSETASVTSLPATATPQACVDSGYIPYVGIASNTSS